MVYDLTYIDNETLRFDFAVGTTINSDILSHNPSVYSNELCFFIFNSNYLLRFG